MTSAQDGMQTLETSLSMHVANGLVEREEAVNHSLHPNEIRTAIGA
jgi:Tfp pilus assembly pilus retraction ATPase PilT